MAYPLSVEEAWEDPKTGRIANVYYWNAENGLQQLITHPKHLEAKRRYSERLGGYQVVISQVMRTYGDKTPQHPLLAGHTGSADTNAMTTR